MNPRQTHRALNDADWHAVAQLIDVQYEELDDYIEGWVPKDTDELLGYMIKRYYHPRGRGHGVMAYRFRNELVAFKIPWCGPDGWWDVACNQGLFDYLDKHDVLDPFCEEWAAITDDFVKSPNTEEETFRLFYALCRSTLYHPINKLLDALDKTAKNLMLVNQLNVEGEYAKKEVIRLRKNLRAVFNLLYAATKHGGLDRTLAKMSNVIAVKNHEAERRTGKSSVPNPIRPPAQPQHARAV